MTPGESERLSPLVARVLAPNPSPMTLTGTNTYLIGRDEIAIVDPGPDMPEHIEAIVDALRALGKPAMSLVTHHHEDHLPAARRLRERLRIPLAGHEYLPGVDKQLTHEQTLVLADTTLRALHTPGHTWDHVCFFLEQERAIFAGDLVAGTGSLVVGPGRGELAASLESLALLRALDPLVIYPGHGPVVPDAGAKLAEYIAHRAEREEQVLTGLSGGLTTIPALVERIYVGIPPGLLGHAARNVQAHLHKLEDEGRVVQRGETWELVRPASTAGSSVIEIAPPLLLLLHEGGWDEVLMVAVGLVVAYVIIVWTGRRSKDADEDEWYDDETGDQAQPAPEQATSERKQGPGQ